MSGTLIFSSFSQFLDADTSTDDFPPGRNCVDASTFTSVLSPDHVDVATSSDILLPRVNVTTSTDDFYASSTQVNISTYPDSCFREPVVPSTFAALPSLHWSADISLRKFPSMLLSDMIEGFSVTSGSDYFVESSVF